MVKNNNLLSKENYLRSKALFLIFVRTQFILVQTKFICIRKPFNFVPTKLFSFERNLTSFKRRSSSFERDTCTAVNVEWSTGITCMHQQTWIMTATLWYGGGAQEICECTNTYLRFEWRWTVFEGRYFFHYVPTRATEIRDLSQDVIFISSKPNLTAGYILENCR